MKKDYYGMLDNLLETINKNQVKVEILTEVSIKLLAEKLGFERLEVLEMYQKLLRDGFIKPQNINETPYGDKYNITFEGYLFIQDGKYKQRNINIQKERERLEVFDKRMGIGTCVLAIGTLFLASIELIAHWNEIVIFFCGCH